MKMILKNIPVLFFFVSLFMTNCATPDIEKYQVQTIEEDGYSYKMVNDDPNRLRIYTLKNGLKVFTA